MRYLMTVLVLLFSVSVVSADEKPVVAPKPVQVVEPVKKKPQRTVVVERWVYVYERCGCCCGKPHFRRVLRKVVSSPVVVTGKVLEKTGEVLKNTGKVLAKPLTNQCRDDKCYNKNVAPPNIFQFRR